MKWFCLRLRRLDIGFQSKAFFLYGRFFLGNGFWNFKDKVDCSFRLRCRVLVLKTFLLIPTEH